MDHFYNFQHVCAALLLIVRLGDIGVDYLVGLGRRIGPYEWIANLYCLVPYYSVDFGIVLLFPFFMLSISRFRIVWCERVEGRQECLDRAIRVAVRARLGESIVLILMESFFWALCGWSLVYFCSTFTEDYVSWFGIGILVWSGITGLHGLRTFIRHRRLGLKTIGSLERVML